MDWIPKEQALVPYNTGGTLQKKKKAQKPPRQELTTLESYDSLQALRPALLTFLEKNEQEREKLARKFSQEQDLEVRTLMHEQLRVSAVLSTQAQKRLQNLKRFQEYLLRHWESYKAGVHPQSHEIERVAELCKVSKSQLAEFEQFVNVVLTWRESYFHIGKEIRERERNYRAEFTEFLQGKHRWQEVITEVAKQLDITISTYSPEKSFEPFVRIMREKSLMRFVKQGLDAADPKEVIAALEESLAQEEARSASLEKERRQAQELVDQTKTELQEMEEALSVSKLETEEQRSRAESAQSRYEWAEQRAGEEKEKRKQSDKELQDRQSGEHERRQKLKQHRERAPEALNTFLIQQERDARNNSGRLRFHPLYGFLQAEARRRLEYEIEHNINQWRPAKAIRDHIITKTDQLLAKDDADQQFLHSEGQQLVRAVQSYLDGEKSLSEVLLESTKVDLQLTMMADPALPMDQLIEAWLRPHRTFQGYAFHQYCAKTFQYQTVVSRFFERHSSHSQVDQIRWRQAWDEHPWVFVCGEDIAKNDFLMV